MKQRNILILLLLTSFTLFSACLKDDVGEYWADDLGKKYATIHESGFHTLGVAPVAGYNTFTFMINLASDAIPTSDIEFTLFVDPDAITAYNAQTKKNYVIYPNIEIMNPVQKITAGKRTAYVTVRVWGAESLDACGNYIAPISIQSVSDPSIVIASNTKSYLMGVAISNPYEGSFQVDGSFVHPTAGTRVIDAVKSLATVDCKTVKGEMGDVGGEVTFTINADNTVTIGGAGLSATQPAVAIPGEPNVYDPATKTLTVSYQYTGSGGFRKMYETWVRL